MKPLIVLIVGSLLTSSTFADDVELQPISRILFGSCIKQDRPIPILHTMLQEKPQLLVFAGDNIYADTSDMDVMRQKYAKLGADPAFQTLRTSCPVLATWDDHDYGENDGGADFAKRAEAEREFLNFWGDAPESARRSRPGVYDARVFGPTGQRLQVILLDTRYFRSPLKKGERRVGGPYVPDVTPSKTMLGHEQWKWLEQQLLVPADVRILVTSIQCIAEAAGQETWSNLPLERKRLFNLIDSTGASGVVLISGDRHWSELSAIDSDVRYTLYELTSSSFNQIHPRGTPTKNRYRAIDKTYHRENYGVILIEWKPDPEITLQIRDIEGRVRIDKHLRLSDLQASDEDAVTNRNEK